MSYLRRPETWVFVILLASYAFFWHSRDWNSASRLMLTYAIVDRGTIRLDGLDEHTRDKAWFQGHYYSDKLPGYSLIATVPYGLARAVLGVPPQPQHVKAAPYWPADYWTTLGASGLLTATCGAVLARLAQRLGCGPRQALLVGLAYGLATPAYVYATMSYGHQASALAILGSFALIWTGEGKGRGPALRAVAAGFLAACASVTELQVGPVSAILGLYLLGLVIARRRPAARLGEFAVGAALPTLLLLGYNQLAFGSPWDMGYFHHATKQFKDVHSADNPLGLRGIDWSRAVPLLWGGHRGLFFYAPITLLAIPGWLVLLRRRMWGVALVSGAASGAIFLVNLSYPEWTGGWSTGPRLLVPLLPLAMLPVAALIAAGGRVATAATLPLAIAGGVLMLLFQGIGGRIPPDVQDPLREVVWPLWDGSPLPAWWVDDRFTRNLAGLSLSATLSGLPPGWRWVQFVPLVVAQVLAIGLAAWACGRRPSEEPGLRPGC